MGITALTTVQLSGKMLLCVGAGPAEQIIFLLEITIDGQTIVIHASVFSGHLEIEQSESVVIAGDKIQVFKQKLEFWKTWICHTFFG